MKTLFKFVVLGWLAVHFAAIFVSCSGEKAAQKPPPPVNQMAYQNGLTTFFVSHMNELAAAGYGEDSVKRIKFFLSSAITLKGAKGVRINEKGEVIWKRADQIPASSTGFVNTINYNGTIINFAVEFTIKDAKYLVWFNSTTSATEPSEFSFSLDQVTPVTVYYKDKSSLVSASSDFQNELKYVRREE